MLKKKVFENEAMIKDVSRQEKNGKTPYTIESTAI